MPSTLAAVLRPHTTSRARARGEAYLRQGRVTIVHSSASSVSARVRGSVPYEVTLGVTDGQLEVGCTCPFFEGSREPCKHVWAVALRADAGRLLVVPPDLVLLHADHPADVPESDAPPLDVLAQASTRSGPEWEALLTRVTSPPPSALPPALRDGQVVYVFDPVRSTSMQGMLVELLVREPRRHGWSRPRPLSLTRAQIADLPDDDDRHLLERICGAQQAYGWNWDGFASAFPVPQAFVLTPGLQRDLVPRLCRTGRMLMRPIAGETDPTLRPMTLDAEPVTFRLHVRDEAGGFSISGSLEQGGESRALGDALFLTGAIVLWRPDAGDEAVRVATFDPKGGQRWLASLVRTGAIRVPKTGTSRLAEALATTGVDIGACPDELRVESRPGTPVPIARLRRSGARGALHARGRLEVTVAFGYGAVEVDSTSSQRLAFDPGAGIAWQRDRVAERDAMERLLRLGVRKVPDVTGRSRRLDLSESALASTVRALLGDGWRVEADGTRYRPPGTSTLGVRSGIDWFEVHGAVDFDGVSADLPQLMAAARRGESFVALDDGTVGLLPDEWLGRHVRVAAMGQLADGHVRFQLSQTALLDAWLAEQPAARWDETFARRRADLAAFDGVTPHTAPPSFTGALRDYQQEALGWFAFLRRFGFGGCLADEMGLGKTVMVLAALDARRAERQETGAPPAPSLIVVPRSLVFNWQQEAARFAPALRVLDATGPRRRGDLDALAEHDVVIATYGTMRRDIARLKTHVFDYAILDEAQAIKNPSTASARAARLLQATHRLALSGTPIENHLGELWSLFEFLNPGLLGSSTAFAATGASGRTPDQDMLDLLARGLRPFILRRTKEQVAAELPARTEQTLYCDLEPAQRRLYDSLRVHYRASLLGRSASSPSGHSTLQVLEALLRLRQAACHPALVDKTLTDAPSAKLDVLIPRLQELVEDGRQVLVFSQFTSLLALVRARLDPLHLRYEYLDGRTRDREARVRRFQAGESPLFLISLKAGGLGLNLTAAEYVFLLDPWWNPAVEAQAIDRAHRIGQARAVFAYRLIARDTVEEKVLELQQSKRTLADAVVRADASLLREMRREDLELLLS